MPRGSATSRDWADWNDSINEVIYRDDDDSKKDEDSMKYDDPFMGYTSEFDEPQKCSNKSMASFIDPSSRLKYSISYSEDEAAYPPSSFEITSSSSKYDSSRAYDEPSSSTKNNKPSSSSKSDDDEWSSKYDLGLGIDESAFISKGDESAFFSEGDSTSKSSSDHDLQSSFTRGILSRDAPLKPKPSKIGHSKVDDRNSYPSESSKYSSGPRSDPYSNEKHELSRRDRVRRRPSRYDD